MNTYVVLDNIRSTHNVGSIFRTSDAAGVSKIYLTGYTPAPVDRFNRPVAEIEKTSLGAVRSVPWEIKESALQCIAELREGGVQIVVVEQDPRAVDYRSWKQSCDTAFVFGNEIEGVSKEVCDAGEVILHIPMHGMKESLNVSVTAGIILFNTTKDQL